MLYVINNKSRKYLWSNIRSFSLYRQKIFFFENLLQKNAEIKKESYTEYIYICNTSNDRTMCVVLSKLSHLQDT